MKYDEAMSLVREGYKLKRIIWISAYIYKDSKSNNQTMYVSTMKIDNEIIMTKLPYFPSYGDYTADDWEVVYDQ